LLQVGECPSFVGIRDGEDPLAHWGFVANKEQFHSQSARSASKALCQGVLFCVTLLALAFPHRLEAQKSDQEGDRNGRKLLVKTEAYYPPDLRRVRIGGTVRLELAVSPRGTVDNVTILGGNPILAQSAINAVKKWKYAPGDSETTVRVSVEFDPNR
jgi:TonB family protein